MKYEEAIKQFTNDALANGNDWREKQFYLTPAQYKKAVAQGIIEEQLFDCWTRNKGYNRQKLFRLAEH